MVLINTLIAGLYPFLHRVPFYRKVLEYNIYELSTVEDWAEKICQWIGNQSQEPIFAHEAMDKAA